MSISSNGRPADETTSDADRPFRISERPGAGEILALLFVTNRMLHVLDMAGPDYEVAVCFILGKEMWRLIQVIRLVREVPPREDEWSDDVVSGLSDLVLFYESALRDSSIIARGMETDLDEVLSACRMSTFGGHPSTYAIQPVVLPFLRALQREAEFIADAKWLNLMDGLAWDLMPLREFPDDRSESSPGESNDGDDPSESPSELVAAAPSGNGQAIEAPAALLDLVTLDQAAAAVHRKKRALEHYKSKAGFPVPTAEGGGGKPDMWDWKIMRPWLETEFRVGLPENFPRSRAN